MKIRKDFALIATLTLCSTIYAAVAIIYTQMNAVREEYDLKDNTLIYVNFNMYNRGIFIGYCAILIWNLIQAAFIFYQNFWTWCQTVCVRISCFGLNVAFAVLAVQTYESCEWKSLLYAPGYSGAGQVCVQWSECSKLPKDHVWCEFEFLGNATLLIPVAALLSVAASLEVVFLVLYRKHTSKNATLPNCCRLTPIDSLTEQNSVIVVDNNSDQPVNQINQSVRNPNFEENTTNES